MKLVESLVGLDGTLDAEFRQQVINKLRRGEELPVDWARFIFPPARREYELLYEGKEREEDIVANTMAVPLQPITSFGKSAGDSQNMLIFGDNLQAMKTLLRLKEDGQLLNADGSSGVKLVYIDPPFGTKQDFAGSRDRRAYQDKVTGSEFIESIRKRLVLIKHLLHEDGSVYVHLDQRNSHYMKVIMDEVFAGLPFRNEIVWRSTNSHSKAHFFGPIHQTILFYGGNPKKFRKLRRPAFKKYLDSNFVEAEDGKSYAKADLTADGRRYGESGKRWNGYDPTKQDRHWAVPSFVYDLVDDDISEFGLLQKLDYLNEHGWIYMPDKDGAQPRVLKPLSDDAGSFMMDIWAYQPYTQGMYAGSREGIDEDVAWTLGGQDTGYPTQKPEGLLRRVIESSTTQGDLVLDCFAGSGTTLAVSEKLGRRWIGIDSGKLAIYTIQKRLLNLRTQIGNKGKSIQPAPFTVYNAGLYDFSRLRDLPWDDWRFFALQLFGCRDDPHSIGGLELDGKLRGASVLVFNHLLHPNSRIDEETIRDIHMAVGSRVGRRFFVIAPRGVFDFQQDYIDMDSVRYYALRIPYSVINELHQRDFTALTQPSGVSSVNLTVDAVGFDFIEPPIVEWALRTKRRNGGLFAEACLTIKKFQTKARIRGEERAGGIETLSMVLLDFNYDGRVFDVDAVFYADEISASDGELWFPADDVGESLMVVFMDIYGNEAREILSGSKVRAASEKRVRKK